MAHGEEKVPACFPNTTEQHKNLEGQFWSDDPVMMVWRIGRNFPSHLIITCTYQWLPLGSIFVGQRLSLSTRLDSSMAVAAFHTYMLSPCGTFLSFFLPHTLLEN